MIRHDEIPKSFPNNKNNNKNNLSKSRTANASSRSKNALSNRVQASIRVITVFKNQHCVFSSSLNYLESLKSFENVVTFTLQIETFV